jgi:hypothetical protein
LIITSSLISCGDSCEQKASEKFWQEQAKIDKLDIGVSTIKNAYLSETYDDIKTLVTIYYINYETKRVILSLTDEQIISMEDEIIELGEVDLNLAKFDLKSMKEAFIKVCK